MAIISTPSPRPGSHTQLPLPTDPNTAMFIGQGAGQRGGRDGRQEEGGERRQKEGKRRGLEILELPRQHVHNTKGTKDGFNRRNVSSDIV